MFYSALGLLALSSTAHPPLILEHCVERAEHSGPYCFLEFITPTEVRLRVKAKDIQKVYETPIVLPDPRTRDAQILKRLKFSLEVIPDALYFRSRKRSLGGYLHQPWQLDASHQRPFTQPFGFNAPVSPPHIGYPSLANPYLMRTECRGKCWNGVVGEMMDKAVNHAAIMGGAGAAVGIYGGPKGEVPSFRSRLRQQRDH